MVLSITLNCTFFGVHKKFVVVFSKGILGVRLRKAKFSHCLFLPGLVAALSICVFYVYFLTLQHVAQCLRSGK